MKCHKVIYMRIKNYKYGQKMRVTIIECKRHLGVDVAFLIETLFRRLSMRSVDEDKSRSFNWVC